MKAPWPAKPPPGPFREGFWRSPLRGPWLTSILGSILLVGFGIVAVTGFLSHSAYLPSLPGNAIVDPSRDLPVLPFWPVRPSWIYALTQGLHVSVGLAVIPLLLAKLWSVMPRLFKWPPVASPAQALERVSIALLVSSAVFQLATGLVNAQYWYPFRFNFVVAHYWGAVVFSASLVLHVAIKLPVIRRAYRERGVLQPLRDDLAHTRPEPRDPDSLVAADPAPPTITRRGLVGFAGGGAGLLLLLNVGQSTGGPLRSLALLAPRRDGGSGGKFPINKTFAQSAIKPEQVGDKWRLVLAAGDREVELSRDDLLAMRLHDASLPIACVEGWSATRRWTGVRLRDLAARAGVPDASQMTAVSLQERGVLRRASFTGIQVHDERALLALRVEGEDLTRDHGYPARCILPGVPGVHNTKWVARLEFEA